MCTPEVLLTKGMRQQAGQSHGGRVAVLEQVVELELGRVGQERVEASMQDVGGDPSLLDIVLKRHAPHTGLVTPREALAVPPALDGVYGADDLVDLKTLWVDFDRTSAGKKRWERARRRTLSTAHSQASM